VGRNLKLSNVLHVIPRLNGGGILHSPIHLFGVVLGFKQLDEPELYEDPVRTAQ